MTTMLEKMARAWWDAREATMPARVRQSWDAGSALARETMIGQCRAALLAVQEPTEAMIGPGSAAWASAGANAEDVWLHAVDAILDEKPE